MVLTKCKDYGNINDFSRSSSSFSCSTFKEGKLKQVILATEKTTRLDREFCQALLFFTKPNMINQLPNSNWFLTKL